MKPVLWIAFVSVESKRSLSLFRLAVVKVKAKTRDEAKAEAVKRMKVFKLKPLAALDALRLSEFDESSAITIGE